MSYTMFALSRTPLAGRVPDYPLSRRLQVLKLFHRFGIFTKGSLVVTQIFSYGTLQHLAVMKAVTGRAYPFESASLPGYRRCSIRNAVYPGVIKAAGQETPGTLYSGIDKKTLLLLDQYEGALYERKLLEVIRENEQAVKAWVYVIPEWNKHILSTQAWTLQAFIEDHLTDYLRAIESGYLTPTWDGRAGK